MKRIPACSVILLLAACSQPPAPLEYKGANYGYGTNAGDTPKYSATNPAPMDSSQAQKYGNSSSYAVPADVGGVAAHDLPPPGASSTGASPGELGVPASRAPHPQALESRGANGSPFGQATPAPVAAVPDVAVRNTPVAPSSAAAAAPALALSDPTPPPIKNEPDYYAQDKAQASVTSAPVATGGTLMDSDETAPSAASPAPKASDQPEFIWPVKGDILTGFGNGNDGIDIAGKKGDPIRAAADGNVSYAANTVKSMGNMVVIDHGGGWLTVYAHANELVVKKGDHIVKEQLLGFVGKTGTADRNEVHFAVRHDGTPVDPKTVLVQD